MDILVIQLIQSYFIQCFENQNKKKKTKLSSFGDFTSKAVQVHMDCTTLHLSRQNHHSLVKFCECN